MGDNEHLLSFLEASVGKPYESDVSAFPDTYAWAMRADISALLDAVSAFQARPLLAIGSGGASCVATFAALLHETFYGSLAKSATPFLAVETPLRGYNSLLISAGGRNPDILGCFRRTVMQEPACMAVVCLRSGSPLAREARKATHVHLAEYDLARKDGFVATNSIVALSILLWRAYAGAFGIKDAIHQAIGDILEDRKALHEYRSRLAQAFRPIAKREHYIVLHGPATHAAAIDLESKFSEAALGSVQIADYRNFAHGRHHWLAKRRESTGVIALIDDDVSTVALATLALLPKTVETCRFQIRGRGLGASLEALVAAQLLAGEAGRSIGLDPGRPGVPPFGRRLFRLNAWSRPTVSNAAVAVQRKCHAARAALRPGRSEEALKLFAERLAEARFAAIVFDYDGTLCDQQHRFTDLPPDVGAEIVRLIRSGIAVGVATGRGASVGKALRNTLPKNIWHHISIGYYNCSQIGLLGQTKIPARICNPSSTIERAASILQSSSDLASVAGVEIRGEQIVVFPHSSRLSESVQHQVEQLVATEYRKGVTCVHSTHSVDVVSPSVSKLQLVRNLESELGPGRSVLCIGDLGSWPGNDYELLAGSYGLSCNEVSPCLDSCWNIAPPGVRNVQATSYYLRHLNLRRGYFRVDVRGMLGA